MAVLVSAIVGTVFARTAKELHLLGLKVETALALAFFIGWLVPASNLATHCYSVALLQILGGVLCLVAVNGHWNEVHMFLPDTVAAEIDVIHRNGEHRKRRAILGLGNGKVFGHITHNSEIIDAAHS